MTSSFWHDYQFTKVNWVDFTVVALSFERDHMVNAALLGLHWRVVWAQKPRTTQAWSDYFGPAVESVAVEGDFAALTAQFGETRVLTEYEVNAAVRAMNEHQAIAHTEDSGNSFDYVFEKGGTVLVRCSCGDEWDVTER